MVIIYDNHVGLFQNTDYFNSKNNVIHHINRLKKKTHTHTQNLFR